MDAEFHWNVEPTIHYLEHTLWNGSDVKITITDHHKIVDPTRRRQKRKDFRWTVDLPNRPGKLRFANITPNGAIVGRGITREEKRTYLDALRTAIKPHIAIHPARIELRALLTAINLKH